jgi:xylulose-5-phosphate/fructose-6-phosphate phosphoketolase
MTVTEQGPLTGSELAALDAWWRAANYLSVGQIYLLSNSLLAEPLRPEHVKPRLLGHWGTRPGLNMIYAHLNRVIRSQDLNVIYLHRRARPRRSRDGAVRRVRDADR